MKRGKRKIKLCALALLVAMVTTFLPVRAVEAVPQLSIDLCNLSFSDSVYIKYAVTANVEDVKLLIWEKPQTEYVVGTQDYELTSLGRNTIDGASYLIFDFTELAAKQMTVDIYARAYTQSSGTNYYSDVRKYSILQYAYNKLGKTGVATTDEKLKTLLTDMLEYGTSAQKYFDYQTGRLANADYYQVKLNGGLLTDGCNHGLYLTGDKVQITAPATDALGNAFLRWEDSVGNIVGRTATYEYTVGTQNVELIPQYIQYSNNLEFDSNGDGTCYVVDLGTCTDTDVVIPAVSPDGDTVIGIDGSAFADTDITSVTLPNTIEEIGRKAFNNCTSLTDVYYDGTEAEWNNISISSGNTPLANATIHFTAEVVKKYTVTFKDWDGTVLKTETVEDGKGAAAPAEPARNGYTFNGWDKAFSEVTGDLVVTATYTQSTEPMLVIGDTNAVAGETKVTLKVSLKNNPGFLTMALKMTFNSDVLTLTKVSNGADYTDYNFTAPRNLSSGCNAAWFLSDLPSEIVDGDVMTLQFTVNANAVPGRYPVTVSCPNDGSTVDGNKTAFNMSDVIGYIIVE